MSMSLTNIKEIKKELEKKQREYELLQETLDASKYLKQVETFINVIRDRGDLINLIKSQNLNPDDSRLLATRISENLKPIYNNFSIEIKSNQEKRAKKSMARKQRRALQRDVTEQVNMSTVNTNPVTSPANPSYGSAVNMDAVPVEGAVRTY